MNSPITIDPVDPVIIETPKELLFMLQSHITNEKVLKKIITIYKQNYKTLLHNCCNRNPDFVCIYSWCKDLINTLITTPFTIEPELFICIIDGDDDYYYMTLTSSWKINYLSCVGNIDPVINDYDKKLQSYLTKLNSL